MSDTRTAAHLVLNCQPSKAGNMLIFPYALENQGPDDVYAMHALPTTDPTSGQARASDSAAIVLSNETGDAIIGKFGAPLPTDRRVAIPVFPLARRLLAGASIEGRIEVRLPLAEHSPYFPDLTLRGHEIVDIKGVQFTIGYWLASNTGLIAAPVKYAPGLFSVMTRDTMRSALRVSQRHPTTGLQLFRRTDAFARVLS